MFSILNRALSWAITRFGHKFCLKKRSRLIKVLNNRFHVKLLTNEFLDNMIRSGHRRLASSFNLCYRLYIIYIDDLIVFNNKKFLDYLKEIYPSQLTVEKANKSDYVWLTTLISHSLETVEVNFQPGYMTNVMILISTLSIFHTFPATYHLALLMVCTFHSSLDMHDAAHTMMISDIATSAWLIDFCHKAI